MSISSHINRWRAFALLSGGFHQTFWVLGAIALIAPPAVLTLARRSGRSEAVAERHSRDLRHALATY